MSPTPLLNAETQEKLANVLRYIRMSPSPLDNQGRFLNRRDLLRMVVDLIPADRAVWAESTPRGVMTLQKYPDDTPLVLDGLTRNLECSLLHSYRCRAPGNRAAHSLSDCLKEQFGFDSIDDLRKIRSHTAVFHDYYLTNNILFQIDVLAQSSQGMFHPLCLHRCKGGDLENDFSEDDKKCLDAINACLDDVLFQIRYKMADYHSESLQLAKRSFIETDRDGRVLDADGERIEFLLRKYFGFDQKLTRHAKLPKRFMSLFVLGDADHLSYTEKLRALSPMDTKMHGKSCRLYMHACFTYGGNRILFLLQEAYFFTAKEIVIISLIEKGHAPYEISGIIGMNQSTVRSTISKIYERINLREDGRHIKGGLQLLGYLKDLLESKQVAIFDKTICMM